MTITATVNDDETITFDWDENDPVESILNTWTKEDFINAILSKAKEVLGEEEYDSIMNQSAESDGN